MTVPEMIALCDGFVAEVQPLLRAAPRLGQARPGEAVQGRGPRDGKIPAHWLPNRWGQNWPGLVEGIDMDAPVQGQAEGVHHRAGRGVLRLARVPQAAEVVLREVRPLPGRPQVRPQEEQPRQRLAHRPARRRPQPDERSSPTAGGSARRTTSSGIFITTSATRRPRCRTCSAPGRTGPSTRGSAT